MADNTKGGLMKMQRRGSSYGVSIPKEVALAVNAFPGRFVDVRALGGAIIITPIVQSYPPEAAEAEITKAFELAIADFKGRQNAARK